MSSRASIIYTSNGTHIYEETNQSQYALNTFAGFDIVWAGFWREYESVSMEGGVLRIKVKAGTELATELGKTDPHILGTDITEIEFDEEGFSFTIRGGSYSARELIKKDVKGAK